MDDVERQTDPTFKKLLQTMRGGNMDDNDINLMLGRVLSNMTNKDKQLFESEGLHLVPTWKQASSINLKYLQTNFETPIAGSVAEMST